MNFEPFDVEYNFDKHILTEDFPEYMLTSTRNWITSVLMAHDLVFWNAGKQYINHEKIILPMNEEMRMVFDSRVNHFLVQVCNNPKLLRNVLSYLLQKVAKEDEANKLELILTKTGSAYAVQITKEKAQNGWTITRKKLIYRVSKIVAEQAAEVLNNSALVQEAWDAFYGLKPDYEKVVTRCSDALAGLIKERFFPNDLKPQLGKLLGQLLQNPKLYTIPGETITDKEEYLKLMQKFPTIRGDHQTGTGRKPNKDEAKFVLHYTITFFHLLELG